MAKVEIYTKATCGYCWRAKELLDHKHVHYTEYAVDFGGPVKQTMIRRSNGQMTVPQIFIDERHVGGCDDLLELERSGQLDSLVGVPGE